LVLDFGLAKIRAEVSQVEGDLKIVGAVMGTRDICRPGSSAAPRSCLAVALI
jgi:hypothetical protein